MSGRRYTDENVWDAAVRRARQVLDTFDRTVVAFSGGKDSTLVLEATISAARQADRLPVEVLYIDDEVVPQGVLSYVERTAARAEVNMRWCCVSIEQRNACSRERPIWYPWADEDRDLWYRPLPVEQPGLVTNPPGWPRPSFLDLHHHVPALLDSGAATVGLITGIRAEEGLQRLRGVSTVRAENWITRTATTPVAQCKVAYDSRTQDIWALAAMLGWDYAEYYDDLERLGISRHEQRTAPPYAEQPIKRMWIWQRLDPASYARLLARVPGAATAARYSTTELYGVGDRRPIPALTWQDTIKRYLSRFSEPTRSLTAGMVATQVRAHYARTPEPIPDDAPHDITGLCWRDLALLASRSDYHARFNPEGKARLLDCSNFREHRDRMTKQFYRRWERRCERDRG